MPYTKFHLFISLHFEVIVFTKTHTDSLRVDRFAPKFEFRTSKLDLKGHISNFASSSLCFGVIVFPIMHADRQTDFRLTDSIDKLIRIYDFGLKSIYKFSSV